MLTWVISHITIWTFTLSLSSSFFKISNLLKRRKNTEPTEHSFLIKNRTETCITHDSPFENNRVCAYFILTRSLTLTFFFLILAVTNSWINPTSTCSWYLIKVLIKVTVLRDFPSKKETLVNIFRGKLSPLFLMYFLFQASYNCPATECRHFTLGLGQRTQIYLFPSVRVAMLLCIQLLKNTCFGWTLTLIICKVLTTAFHSLSRLPWARVSFKRKWK